MSINPYRLGLAVAAITAVATGYGAATTESAHADQHWSMHPVHTQTWLQPYGGCDESMPYANSQGSDDCRAHGWTITRHIVVSPTGYVRSLNMPACVWEDGSGGPLPCYWDGDTAGNGHGLSYWVSPNGRSHYVKGLAEGTADRPGQ